MAIHNTHQEEMERKLVERNRSLRFISVQEVQNEKNRPLSKLLRLGAKKRYNYFQVDIYV